MPQFQPQKQTMRVYRVPFGFVPFGQNKKKGVWMTHQKTTDEEMIVAIVVAGWLEDRTVSEAARQTSSVSEQEGELKVGGRQCIIVFPPP